MLVSLFRNALFTYRNLYNLKILLAGFLFLMTGLFCLYYFFGFAPVIFRFLQVEQNDNIHLLVYLFYSWNLLVISLVPANMPKTFSRLFLTLIISLEGILLFGGTRYLLAAMETYLPQTDDMSLSLLTAINGLIVICAQGLSFKRRDVYAWPITGFVLLFTVAYAARGRDLEILLLLFVPVALVFMVMANLMLSLSHRANYDPLLNIYNRGYANNFLQGKVRSLSKGYAVGIFDLDHFKRLNDRYGHQAGDRILFAVAQKIREKALPHGIACRYGGEEFMVIFPNLSITQAAKLAQEMVAAIAQMQIPVSGKKKRKAFKVRVTISGGIAAAKSNKNSQDVVQAADKALYRAKRGGRNRLSVVRQPVH